MTPPSSISMVTMGFCAIKSTPFCDGPGAVRRIISVPASGFHRSVHLPLGVSFGRRFPLIIELFALGQAQLQLDSWPTEVDGQGDQGVAVLLDPGKKLQDLPFVHQQAALPQRSLLKMLPFS